MLQNLLITIPAALFALGVIVFVHELGHHLAAKLCGVRVKIFSLGFGTRAWGFERGGTDYRVSWIPLGGYVRMAGELPEERSGRADDFLSKPRWQRIFVYLAGPAMNVVLAIALVAGVFAKGSPITTLQSTSTVIGHVAPDSPAERAGLQVGDRVVEVAGKPVEQWKDLAFEITVSPEKPVTLVVERADQRFEREVIPEKVSRYEIGDAGLAPRIRLLFVDIRNGMPAEAAGFEAGDEVVRLDGLEIWNPGNVIDHISSRPGQEILIEVRRDGQLLSIPVVPNDVEGRGLIGVGIDLYSRPLPLGEAVVASAYFNVDVVVKTVQIVGKLLRNELAAKNTISGPIEIAAQSGEAVRRSFTDLIFFMGFLSISIAFMNLLPIPILDGGHITILLIESALRRDLSMTLKERITQVGFVLLMTLMAMVIFFDISRNLPGLLGS